MAMTKLPCSLNAQSNPPPGSEWPPLATLEAHAPDVWIGDVGSGFRADVQSVSLCVGGLYGFAKFGGREAHHLALTSVSYGRMLGPLQGQSWWFRGNWEFQIELFGGAQFRPDVEWIAGITPHLRYNFATGTRLTPFVDFGAGLTGTGIGTPDLGSRFQFNEQAGLGAHWFLTRSTAITLEVFYMHLSNAGIKEPNCGVNGVKGLIGLTFFF